MIIRALWISGVLIVLPYSVAADKSASKSGASHTHAFASGFVSGSDFRKMSAVTKSGYAMGLIDGYMSAPHFSGASPGWKKLYTCLTQQDFNNPGASTPPPPGMSNEQVTAILEKYLEEHPEEWHLPMNAIGISAFSKSCGIQGF